MKQNRFNSCSSSISFQALQDKVSEKDIHFKAQNIKGVTLSQGEEYSATLHKDAIVSEDSSSTVQECGKVAIFEHKLKLIASSLTGDPSIESGASDPKSLLSLSERSTSLSSNLENAHPTSVKKSLEQPKESSGLFQKMTTPFQFNKEGSHRTVTPNLSSSASSILRFDDAPPDYKHVVSKSPGSEVSLTDMSPLSPVFIESSSAQSTDSLISIGNVPAGATASFQLSPDFEHVLSEFEKTLATLDRDTPGLVSKGTALAPGSKETTHELKVSEQSTDITDDVRLMDADLKVKAGLVHAESLESDPDFFDCRQTFSDTPEPDQEIRPGELLAIPGTIYQVEEPPSLPSTPDVDYLTGKLKTSDIGRENRQRPISWGSEELDVPIVLEPEDEYVGEHGEDIAYPYRYADEHSFAEELPPREGAQYDDDDDSLGRVSLEHECYHGLLPSCLFRRENAATR